MVLAWQLSRLHCRGKLDKIHFGSILYIASLKISRLNAPVTSLMVWQLFVYIIYTCVFEVKYIFVHISGCIFLPISKVSLLFLLRLHKPGFKELTICWGTIPSHQNFKVSQAQFICWNVNFGICGCLCFLSICSFVVLYFYNLLVFHQILQRVDHLPENSLHSFPSAAVVPSFTSFPNISSSSVYLYLCLYSCIFVLMVKQPTRLTVVMRMNLVSKGKLRRKQSRWQGSSICCICICVYIYAYIVLLLPSVVNCWFSALPFLFHLPFPSKLPWR